MIKYRYAVDKYESLIDVQNLERIQLTKDEKFYSLDFKQELIPRLGKIKMKHFAHKSILGVLGSRETYLHALGKKIFFTEYTNSLESKTPFFLDYVSRRNCIRLKEEYDTTCSLKEEKRKFDLSKYYKEILMEKKDDNFIPDLMLLNTTTKEKIYIEIAVTHQSSVEKINAANRILEFFVDSEEDAEELRNFKLGRSNTAVQYHNFKQNLETGIFCKPGGCCKKFNFFRVSEEGKCLLTVVKEYQIKSSLENCPHNFIWKIIEPSHDIWNDDESTENLKTTFINYVALAHNEEIAVKNCYICRYHADNTSYEDIPREPIFCKFKKMTCTSNHAATCQYYKVHQAYVDVAVHRWMVSKP